MKIHSLWIPGVPIPNPHDVVRRGKKQVRIHRNPSIQAQFEAWRSSLRAEMHELSGRGTLHDGPVLVSTLFCLPIPESKAKKKAPPLLVDVRPDWDNLSKPVLDAMTWAGLWVDDGRSPGGLPLKVYSKPHGAFVYISEVPREPGPVNPLDHVLHHVSGFLQRANWPFLVDGDSRS